MKAKALTFKQSLNEFNCGKEVEDNTNFNRFISSCMKELRKYKQTVCFNEEQVKEIERKCNNTKVEKRDFYYLVSEK